VDYFLENIADPNAVIGDDFQLTIVTKKDDSVVAGMVEKESDTSLVVRTLTESVSIPKGDIKSRNKLAQSLMPPGLLDAMSEREALELLKFLSTKP
jgi:putative heme-binding domain-containing protein